MLKYHYIAVMPSGERVDGVLSSRDRHEALRRLRELSYHPISLVPADEARTDVRHLLRDGWRRIGTTDLAVLTRQLSALLQAGMPMLEALQTLRRQSANPRLAAVIGEVEQTLSRDAGTLADALDQHPRVFDGVYRGMVRSGEEGGNLAEVLDDLAASLSRAARVRGQVFAAFLYPAFLLLLGAAAIFVLMSFVIPRFSDLFESFDQRLPRATEMLMAVSSFLDAWWWAVLAAVLAGSAAAAWAVTRPSVRRPCHLALLRAPVLGPMCLKIEIARIARTLGVLLGSGVVLLDALRIAADTVSNVVLRESFESMARDVSGGQDLAHAIERTGHYPPLVVNLVRTGEHTGRLPEMLSELSEIYEDESQRAVTAAVKLLEPVLILVMGLVIAGIVAAVMLPVFQTSAMIS
ncbi:MAG: hypothetical protein CMJ18_05515 [Phycisphaeraceae bacterium]|nr:hypothetical protein [Phycisphaeraceae bacterium]